MKLIFSPVQYLLAILVVSLGVWFGYSYGQIISIKTQAEETYSYNTNWANLTPSPTPSPTLTPTPSPRPTRAPLPTQMPQPTSPWGVAEKIGENTYTIKIQYDASMASPQDVFAALNTYRSSKGKGALIWDDTLANYASGRAETFRNMNGTDAHAGFNSYLDNEDGFHKLHMGRLGENSYYGGPVTGTHVIEWVFAQSPGHNANQLGDWTHVGVGVTGTSIDLIFGANQL